MAKAKSSNAVGVIGLGSMGLGVARTLLGKGFRSMPTTCGRRCCRDFARKGGKACASPAEVGAKAPVVIVLVVNAEQTDEVLFGRNGAAARMARGSVVIASATVAPAFAEQLGAAAAQQGIHMIDAPVSGGAARAATGQLSIMASGTQKRSRAAEAVLERHRRQGLPPGRRARHGLEGEDDQPASGRRAHRRLRARRWRWASAPASIRTCSTR